MGTTNEHEWTMIHAKEVDWVCFSWFRISWLGFRISGQGPVNWLCFFIYRRDRGERRGTNSQIRQFTNPLIFSVFNCQYSIVNIQYQSLLYFIFCILLVKYILYYILHSKSTKIILLATFHQRDTNFCYWGHRCCPFDKLMTSSERSRRSLPRDKS